MIRSKIEIWDERILFLDSSVIINLHASMIGEQIFQAIPNQKKITKNVKSELSHSTSHNCGTHSFLEQLLASKLIDVVSMKDEEYELYSSLISSSNKKSINDGEASVIAIAKIRYAKDSCVTVMDDKKGINTAEKYLNGSNVCTTMDLLCHPAVISTQGVKKVSDAIYSSLKYARMRISKELCDDVIKTIGIERAKECNSLPGFSKLFKEI